MPKSRGEKKAESTTHDRTDHPESVSGYFRRIFKENPKLLDSRSNDELLKRWLADHPGQEAAAERVRQNLSNVKSVLRKRGRLRGRRKQEAEAAAQSKPVKARHDVGSLEALEEHIDEALTVAKVLDREGLANVIQLLRRARNEVVWKMGQ